MAAAGSSDGVLSILVPSRRYPTLESAIQGAASNGRRTVISLLEGSYEVKRTVSLRRDIVIQGKLHVNGVDHDSVKLLFTKAPGVELLHPGSAIIHVDVSVQHGKPYGRSSFAVVVDAPQTTVKQCSLHGGGIWVKCGTAARVVVSHVKVTNALSHGFYITEANTRKHVFRAEHSARRVVQREIAEREGSGRDVYDWEFDADDDDDELAAELAALATAATKIEATARGFLARSALLRSLCLHNPSVIGAQQHGIFVDGAGAFGEMKVNAANVAIERCHKHGALVQGQARVVVMGSVIRYCDACGVLARTVDTQVVVRSGTCVSHSHPPRACA